MSKGPTPFDFPFKDIPEVNEIFADDMHLMTFNGQYAHFTFTVDRMDEFKPGVNKKPTGKKVAVARLVLTPTAMLKMVNSLNQIVGALEQQGTVKREQPAIINPGGSVQ